MPAAGGRRAEDLVFNGYIVSVWNNSRFRNGW